MSALTASMICFFSADVFDLPDRQARELAIPVKIAAGKIHHNAINDLAKASEDTLSPAIKTNQ